VAKSASSIISVDTGGTFTDFYAITPQGIKTHKVLSTPADPSRAIRQGLKELAIGKDFEIVHGSTVATNALLEQKGVRLVLLTTEGFEDVLEIGRQNRSSLYDLNVERPPPLVGSKERIGVKERIDARGQVLTKLDARELKRIFHLLRRSPAESVAICLLFSFLNPAHEKKLAQLLKPFKKFISVSSEICPEYREYERFSTTCLNAYVAPIMSKYLRRLQTQIPQRIRVMQSNGGSLSVTEAEREAVRTLLSGPAGGALGALRVARQAGYERILSLDMGGTSTDLSLIDGDLELTSEATVGGYPIKTPMIRIDTLGAGGGSIARLDAGGALRVGPESAAAKPGPICYGGDGRELTVTDAHLWLGRIPANHFLGGEMKLYREKILKPLSKLAKQMHLSPEATAEGILTVANANMDRALRVLSLERGYDPRDFTLLCFGGAGALHACELAELLAVPRILVPPHPGILSAFGMAGADWVRDYVQTVLLQEKAASPRKLQQYLEVLKRRAKQDAEREGLSYSKLELKAQLDVRYQGQSYELTIKLEKNFRNIFEEAHRRHYGYLHFGRPLEVVNLRLQASFRFKRKLPTEQREPRRTPRPIDTIDLYWRGKFYRARIYLRKQLSSGTTIRGPAIIAEYSATTLLPPKWVLKCDRFGNLVLNK
jgi:N-methylhydantoinase A